ncbi:MAG: hypothetical protein ACM3ST_05310 [Bdellovibrio bacteriovorus]
MHHPARWLSISMKVHGKRCANTLTGAKNPDRVSTASQDIRTVRPPKSSCEKNMVRWNDPELHQLATDFFRTFSRVEYALKTAGYLVQHKKNAEADWTAFAQEIDYAFLCVKTEALKEAQNYIFMHPPRKAINNNGKIEWERVVPDHKNQTDLLLQYVRRIRNNLFHGGKFNGRWFQPERSGPLVHAGLVILNSALACSEKVQAAYSS